MMSKQDQQSKRIEICNLCNVEMKYVGIDHTYGLNGADKYMCTNDPYHKLYVRYD